MSFGPLSSITGQIKTLVMPNSDSRDRFFYNTCFVYCRELNPGTVSLTSDWVRGDVSKHYRY